MRRRVAIVVCVIVLVLQDVREAGGHRHLCASERVQQGGHQASAGRATGGEAQSYYQDGRRIVIRTVAIEVEIEDYDSAFEDARWIARRQDGFIAEWNHTVDRGWDRARLVINVPAGNFSAARDALAELGIVERENVEANDFTSRYQNTNEGLGPPDRKTRTPATPQPGRRPRRSPANPRRPPVVT